MTDAKAEKIVTQWHSQCVAQGLTGRWQAQFVVRDGEVVSYPQTSQSLAFGQAKADLNDQRNRAALGVLLDWFRKLTIENARVVVYAEYTNGVTSPSRVYAGVISSLG